jgi:hypothetical protein
MESQYLKSDVLNAAIGDIYNSVQIDDLISADTYNETLMLEKYNEFDDDAKQLLFKCAVQIAVIGAGGKSFGKVRLNDGNVVDIVDVFDKFNIKYNRNINEKYEPNDLSARRLVRFFRYSIQKFIEVNQRPSYLWAKYTEKEMKYASICFPGGEHLVEKRGEIIYLTGAYKNLDQILGTKFTDRLRRVLIARNVLTVKEIDDIIG